MGSTSSPRQDLPGSSSGRTRNTPLPSPPAGAATAPPTASPGPPWRTSSVEAGHGHPISLLALPAPSHPPVPSLPVLSPRSSLLGGAGAGTGEGAGKGIAMEPHSQGAWDAAAGAAGPPGSPVSRFSQQQPPEAMQSVGPHGRRPAELYHGASPGSAALLQWPQQQSTGKAQGASQQDSLSHHMAQRQWAPTAAAYVDTRAHSPGSVHAHWEGAYSQQGRQENRVWQGPLPPQQGPPGLAPPPLPLGRGPPNTSPGLQGTPAACSASLGLRSAPAPVPALSTALEVHMQEPASELQRSPGRSILSSPRDAQAGAASRVAPPQQAHAFLPAPSSLSSASPTSAALLQQQQQDQIQLGTQPLEEGTGLGDWGPSPIATR